MRYLFDNDSISILYDVDRGIAHTSITERISQLADTDQLQTSVLILYELEFSYHNAPAEKKTGIRKTIDSLQEDFEILPVSVSVAFIFGELKAFLKNDKNLSRKEMRKHNIDIALATTAIQEGSVIISSDDIYAQLARCKENLIFENWIGTK